MSELELHYELRPLPPGRFPFHRWRWELWHGERLCASGWRTSPAHAERALRTYAARIAHRRLGLTPLRPETATLAGRLSPGAPARLDCGAVSCWLVPRALLEAA
jgi:hypothetical protein